MFLRCHECNEEVIPLNKGAHKCSQCNSLVIVNDACEVISKPESKESLQLKNDLWKSGARLYPEKPTQYRVGDYPDSPFKDLKEEFQEKKPGALYCTWCGVEVPSAEATIGKVPRVSGREEIVSLDPLLTKYQIFHSSTQIVGCPEHSLLVGQHVKFTHSLEEA